MPFASLTFCLLALPAICLCYTWVPEKYRQLYLVVCCCILYSWGNPVKLYYPAGFLCYDYVTGIWLAKCRKPMSAILLTGSVVLQAAVLLHVRYLAQNHTDMLFPVGIAVYTLQGLGYLIGIYRKQHHAEKNFIRFGVYLLLFPLQFAAPLMDYQNFQKQAEKQNHQNMQSLNEGIEIFLRGLAEKVIFADMLGHVFAELQNIASEQLSMLTAWLTASSFSMYFYYTLLGYSEMARGFCKCFGYDLPKNFKYPFFSSSMTTFTQRWHITLVSWFQEYFRHFLFGEQISGFRKYCSLVLMWIGIGAWYGSTVTLLLWGLCTGIILLLEQLFLQQKIHGQSMIGIVYTTILLHFLWVLFFTDNLTEAGYYWKAMLGFGSGFTDTGSIYYLTSYIGLFLFSIYISTELFGNMSEWFATRIGQKLPLCKSVLYGILFLFCLACMLYQQSDENFILRI